jgi:hypothetical protein
MLTSPVMLIQLTRLQHAERLAKAERRHRQHRLVEVAPANREARVFDLPVAAATSGTSRVA